MTTVRPSARTLPTWKTDGLRFLLTEGSPRRSPVAGPVVHVAIGGTGRDIGRNRMVLYPLREIRPVRGFGTSAPPGTERNRSATFRRRHLCPGVRATVVGTAPP